MSVGLTDEQRARFLELVRTGEHGHVLALRQVGVQGTKGELKQLLAEDPELLADIRDAKSEHLTSIGLGVPALLKQLAAIASNAGNASQLRAVVYGLSFHGIHVAGERRELEIEHTGAGGGPVQIEDRSASLADVARVLEAVGALAELRGGAARDALPAAPRLLAPPADG